MDRTVVSQLTPADQFGFSRGTDEPKAGHIAKRLCKSYQHQYEQFEGFEESSWKRMADQNHHLHEGLLANDLPLIKQLVKKPTDTNLFHGFDGGSKTLVDMFKRDLKERDSHIDLLSGVLRALTEAVGAVSMNDPEAEASRPANLSPDESLRLIEKQLDVSIKLPNLYADDYGIATERGICSYRTLLGIYQAWKLRELSSVYGSQIVEIGGGLGKTAYYSWLFGNRTYTIVDLPLTSMAQGIFLMRAMGPERVVMPGETMSNKAAVRILTPTDFEAETNSFDVAFNAESFTEMDRSHAESYVKTISQRAKVLLSVNHAELNSVKMEELGDLQKFRLSRRQYCLRPGYFEEIYHFPH